MRLIDGDALIIDLMDRGIDHLQTKDWNEIQQTVEDAPTVDAVPVVRCGECKHREEKTFWCEKVQDFISNPEWFCADGERKGGDERWLM